MRIGGSITIVSKNMVVTDNARVSSSTIHTGDAGAITAKVAAIDPANRRVTLVSDDGIKQVVKVGPEAINFDQIRVGDQLKIVSAWGEALIDAAWPMPDDTGDEGAVAEFETLRQVITAISRGIDPYRDWNGFLAVAEQPELRFAVSNTTEEPLPVAGAGTVVDDTVHRETREGRHHGRAVGQRQADAQAAGRLP